MPSVIYTQVSWEIKIKILWYYHRTTQHLPMNSSGSADVTFPWWCEYFSSAEFHELSIDLSMFQNKHHKGVIGRSVLMGHSWWDILVFLAQPSFYNSKPEKKPRGRKPRLIFIRAEQLILALKLAKPSWHACTCIYWWIIKLYYVIRDQNLFTASAWPSSRLFSRPRFGTDSWYLSQLSVAQWAH